LKKVTRIKKKEVSVNVLWKAIRKQCLECMGNQRNIAVREVILCTSPKCSLYDFRLGKDGGAILPLVR
jgi:aconitase B